MICVHGLDSRAPTKQIKKKRYICWGYILAYIENRRKAICQAIISTYTRRYQKVNHTISPKHPLNSSPFSSPKHPTTYIYVTYQSIKFHSSRNDFQFERYINDVNTIYECGLNKIPRLGNMLDCSMWTIYLRDTSITRNFFLHREHIKITCGIEYYI